MQEQTRLKLYGVLAEFSTEDEILRAAREVRNRGYRRVEAYTPFPVHGLAEILGVTNRRLPWIVLGAGLTGGIGGLLLQWYSATIHYPLNVGGRPLASWPSFIPVAFELTILLASGAAVLGMFALNGMPQPYHPVFNVAAFSAASSDRFFLCIEAEDPQFDLQETSTYLSSLGAMNVYEVDP